MRPMSRRSTEQRLPHVMLGALAVSSLLAALLNIKVIRDSMAEKGAPYDTTGNRNFSYSPSGGTYTTPSYDYDMAITVMLVISSFVTAATAAVRSMWAQSTLFGTIFVFHGVFLVVTCIVYALSGGADEECEGVQDQYCKSNGPGIIGSSLILAAPTAAVPAFILSWVLAQYARQDQDEKTATY